MSAFTKEKLLAIVPSAQYTKLGLDDIVARINMTFASFDDDYKFFTINRQAAFIAQTAYESGSYCHNIENLNYSAQGLLTYFPKYFDFNLAVQYAHQSQMIANRVYANRLGNNNEASGDGWKYRGRGFIQVTGKNNYTDCSKYLNKDFVSNPDLMTSIEYSFKSAVWYWHTNKLNDYADKDDIKTITKIINGGYNGLEARIAFYEKAKKVLNS